MFVDLICETPELLYNEFTMAFLKLNDEKKLNLKKKESEYMTKPSKISEIINVEGTAHIKSTKENKIFTHYVGEYLNSAEPIYLKLVKYIYIFNFQIHSIITFSIQYTLIYVLEFLFL